MTELAWSFFGGREVNQEESTIDKNSKVICISRVKFDVKLMNILYGWMKFGSGFQDLGLILTIPVDPAVASGEVRTVL